MMHLSLFLGLVLFQLQVVLAFVVVRYVKWLLDADSDSLKDFTRQLLELAKSGSTAERTSWSWLICCMSSIDLVPAKPIDHVDMRHAVLCTELCSLTTTRPATPRPIPILSDFLYFTIPVRRLESAERTETILPGRCGRLFVRPVVCPRTPLLVVDFIPCLCYFPSVCRRLFCCRRVDYFRCMRV